MVAHSSPLTRDPERSARREKVPILHQNALFISVNALVRARQSKAKHDIIKQITLGQGKLRASLIKKQVPFSMSMGKVELMYKFCNLSITLSDEKNNNEKINIKTENGSKWKRVNMGWIDCRNKEQKSQISTTSLGMIYTRDAAHGGVDLWIYHKLLTYQYIHPKPNHYAQ